MGVNVETASAEQTGTSASPAATSAAPAPTRRGRRPGPPKAAEARTQPPTPFADYGSRLIRLGELLQDPTAKMGSLVKQANACGLNLAIGLQPADVVDTAAPLTAQ